MCSACNASGQVQPGHSTSDRCAARAAAKKTSSTAMEADSNLSVLLAAFDSDLVKQICEKLKNHTGGRFDIHMIAAACLAAETAFSALPAVLTTVFDQIKTNVSSSITVNYNDFQLYNGILRFAREKATTSNKSWYKFSG